MTTREGNEETVHSLFEEVINGQAYDRIPTYCAPDITLHHPGDVTNEGHSAYETHYRSLHAVFPDFEATLTDVVADANRVAVRFSVTGTHRGELLGIDPTGTEVQFPAQVLFRLDEGAITEEFHQSDRYALRKQLLGES